ncbi:MAG: hypothetical protein ACE5JU_20535, partial [Candidatus Binatia bacterium]
MADKLKILISSRVNDQVPTAAGGRTTLREVRQEIRQRLRNAFDGHSIQVWINEEEPAETDLDAVGRCERWADQAHLVLVIINGHPGAPTPRGLGICHLELKTAVDDSPNKVLLIKVATKETDRNFGFYPEFKHYFEGLWSNWRKFGATVTTAEEIVEKAVQSV